MRALVFVCFVVGCATEVEGAGNGNGGPKPGTSQEPPGTRPPGPPPAITSVWPLDGDYGTEVTIAGDNFDDPSAKLVLSAGAEPVTYTQAQGRSAKVVTTWTKNEIKFKYPFPGDGLVRVASSSGQADGDRFTATWTPGTPTVGAFTRKELLAVVSPAAGTTVAALDGASGPLIVIGRPDGSISTKAFNRGSTALLTMSLYVTPSGGVDGFFSSGGQLWRLTDALGAATTASTGVAAAFAAGGEDSTGPYAWIRQATGSFTRVRPPGWNTPDSTVADPAPANAPGKSIAVGPDHSLFSAWGYNDGGDFPTYDHTASTRAARLKPATTTFGAAFTVGTGADDYMIWSRLRPGPDGRVASFFCASDTGILASTTTDCREGYYSNGIPVPNKTVAREYVVGYNATVAIAASCEASTSKLRFGPEKETAQQVPVLFPCPSSVVAVSVDPAGAGHLLVRSGNSLFAPRKR